MANLRYVTLGPERLRDTVEARDFVAVRYMNAQLEKAAVLVESAAAENADDEGCEVSTSTLTKCIRYLKEKV